MYDEYKWEFSSSAVFGFTIQSGTKKNWKYFPVFVQVFKDYTRKEIRGVSDDDSPREGNSNLSPAATRGRWLHVWLSRRRTARLSDDWTTTTRSEESSSVTPQRKVCSFWIRSTSAFRFPLPACAPDAIRRNAANQNLKVYTQRPRQVEDINRF